MSMIYTRACRRHTHFCFRRVGSKVGSTITSNSVHCFSFSPAVRIPPPPALLWHPAHCVHSWEHWPPPLWEWTCGVWSGSLCVPIPLLSSLCGCTLHLSLQNNYVSPFMHAPHGHILYTDCLTVHLISCTPVSSTLYLVWLVAYELNLIWSIPKLTDICKSICACIIHILHKVNYIL